MSTNKCYYFGIKNVAFRKVLLVTFTPIAHLHIHFHLIWKQTGAVL